MKTFGGQVSFDWKLGKLVIVLYRQGDSKSVTTQLLVGDVPLIRDVEGQSQKATYCDVAMCSVVVGESWQSVTGKTVSKREI